MIRKRNSRRHFLKNIASGAAATPWIVPATAVGHEGRAAPSQRITVALIGAGKMANDYHIPEILRMPDAQMVAVCEVDAKRREHAKKRVDDRYAVQDSSKGCGQCTDFRQVLARKDIDAVVIATPEHWHAIPAIEACRAGKDVYCEKPLTLTILEAKRCVEAARKFGCVFQTGSQQRSNVFGPFRQAVEIIRSGRLGKIHTVHVGVGGPSRWCDLLAEPVEPGLDWDLWLGQAPARPYHSALSPRGVHNHFPAWWAYRESLAVAGSVMGISYESTVIARTNCNSSRRTVASG